MPEDKTINGNQLVEMFKAHMQITVMGLIAKFNSVPPEIMTPAMCEAFGQVLSEATFTGDLAATIKLRKTAREAFEAGLKQIAPTQPIISTAGMRPN